MCQYNLKDLSRNWPRQIKREDAITAYKYMRRNRKGVWKSYFRPNLYHNNRLSARPTFNKEDNSAKGIYAYAECPECYSWVTYFVVKIKLWGKVYKFKREWGFPIPGYVAEHCEIVGKV